MSQTSFNYISINSLTILTFSMYTQTTNNKLYMHCRMLSQTSFGHISIKSPSILTVSMATESPWKDLLISTSHVSRQSVMAEILGRSTGNHYGTVY